MRKYKLQYDGFAWRVVYTVTSEGRRYCLAEFFGKGARNFASQHKAVLNSLPKKDRP